MLTEQVRQPQELVVTRNRPGDYEYFCDGVKAWIWRGAEGWRWEAETNGGPVGGPYRTKWEAETALFEALTEMKGATR